MPWCAIFCTRDLAVGKYISSEWQTKAVSATRILPKDSAPLLREQERERGRKGERDKKGFARTRYPSLGYLSAIVSSELRSRHYRRLIDIKYLLSGWMNSAGFTFCLLARGSSSSLIYETPTRSTDHSPLIQINFSFLMQSESRTKRMNIEKNTATD